MSGTVKGKRRLRIAVAVLVTVAAAVAILLARKSAEKASERAVASGGGRSNPYAYDISELRKVPPQWIAYRELPPVQLGVPSPAALSVDAAGNILVAGGNTLLKLAPSGAEATRFNLDAPPVALAISEIGVLVALCDEKCDVLSAENGTKKLSIPLPSKAIPTSVAVSGNSIYIADAGNSVVWRYSLQSGELLGKIGCGDRGKGVPTIIIPSPHFDVAVAPDGSVWLANTGRHSLESFSPDGGFRYSWSRPATGPKGFSGCCNPSDFAITPEGMFVTAEKNIPRVKIYDQTGEFVNFVAPPAAFAENAIILDIAYNPVTRQVLLLDSKSKTLRRFKKKQAERLNRQPTPTP